MRISFTFRNLEPSDGIKSYASEKVARIQKFLRVPLHAEVTLSTERHLHVAEVAVVADGKRYAGHEQSEDMYASIDLAMDKIDRQVRDSKAALTDRKRRAQETVRAPESE
ncbi:MAG: ribosome-associated translation inhibitor RaiA [Myxococcales bacterium]|nr:ribosome-associated translation inhibitor RaiA [Myxococcales bacterium]